MIQRSLLRSSRATASRLANRTPISPLRPQSPFVRISTAQPTKIASRWYSEAKAGATETSTEGAAKEAEKPVEGEGDKLKKELEAKNKEVIDLKDKYLRAVAEQRNIQERAKREVQAAKDFALQKFANDLVDSVDNLDRALSTVPAEKLHGEAHTEHQKDLVTLHDGLKMTERILMQTLKKHGLERFDPSEANEKFDPNVHEAVFQAPQPGKEHGTVFHTQQKGFTLNGRVIRPAKVGVVKNE